MQKFSVMQKLRINTVKYLPVVICLLAGLMPFAGFAQDPGGGPDAPIDGGLSVLLAAGAAYGVKKYRDNRKAQNSSETEK